MPGGGFVQELMRRVPAPWRPTVRLALVGIGLVGGAGLAFQAGAKSQRPELRHCEEMLAPFQAAALKAFPGEDAAKATASLQATVEGLASQVASTRERDLQADMQSCFTELAMNGVVLDQLAKLKPELGFTGRPQVEACTQLMKNPGLATPLRQRLVLYIDDMDSARRRFDGLLDSCQHGPIPQPHIAESVNAGTSWSSRVASLKTDLATEMTARGVPIPIAEGVAQDGSRTISVCN